MLIPKEKPYLEGLNSYYLHLGKFIEHLQGDIGSGGIHCLSPSSEMIVYFNEQEIISSYHQEKDGPVTVSPEGEMAHSWFLEANFAVKVYQLDDHAIFFWAQMPPVQHAKAVLKSTEILLPELVFRLKQKRFSGFIEVQLLKKAESGILFFHEGKRIGGSYSWGKGGMTTADEEYNFLLGETQTYDGVFSFGSFINGDASNPPSAETSL